MKVKIIASAPTTYQLTELNYFNLNKIESELSGIHAEKEFSSTEKAKEHLRTIAEEYFETEKECNSAFSQIENYGTLTLDAITATIEEK